MDIKDLLKTVDHTLLAPQATWDDIKAICDDGIRYGTASVCIPACFVKRAAVYVGGEIPICTVIGFPCGYSTTDVKVKETEDAVKNGADEIDMVINIGALKDGDLDYVLNEIKAVRAACQGKVLKVIIETCLLDEYEKIKMCELVSQSGADFIKTSTGFSTGGATFDDIKLFRAHVAPHVKIKAAGGIKSLDDGYEFLRLGANRLGTSRIVKIIKEDADVSDTAY